MKVSRVLLVDIGNSRIKWRIVSDRAGRDDHDATGPSATRAKPSPTVVDDGVVALADIGTLAGRWQGRAAPAPRAAFVSNVAAASVGEALGTAIAASWPDVIVHVVQPSTRQCGVVNGYDEPSRLGPDRWLALLAAHALDPARSALVCNFGTATTIDLLEAARPGAAPQATFVGGLILPGLDTMRESLVDRTARLPLADGDVVPFATRTADAIASGVMAAQVGAVEHAWRDALARRASAGGDTTETLVCLVAGGGGASIAPWLVARGVPAKVVEDLVLQGLARVAFDTLGTSPDVAQRATPTTAVLPPAPVPHP